MFKIKRKINEEGLKLEKKEKTSVGKLEVITFSPKLYSIRLKEEDRKEKRKEEYSCQNEMLYFLPHKLCLTID